MTKYTPATGLPRLKEVVAGKFSRENGIKTNPSRVIAAPGAKFSVFSTIVALCGPGDEVILPAPYWVSYPEMIKASGAKPVVVNTRAENNFEVDPAELRAAVNGKTKLMILNSPSNPTGAVYRKKTLEAVAEIAVENNFMILADEIYEKLVYDDEFPHISIASLGDEISELTVTVNGLSKAYSMTGWRLGYLTAPEWLGKRIAAVQSHTTSNPTSFVQAAGIEAITRAEDDVNRMRQAFCSRRDLIFSLVKDIPGITSIRPSGTFYIFCDISSFGMGSWDFCDRLLEEEKVAVIPGEPFGSEGNIRISFACSEDNIRKAVGRLKSFCSKL
jgi:aspartate aminotransferase